MCTGNQPFNWNGKHIFRASNKSRSIVWICVCNAIAIIDIGQYCQPLIHRKLHGYFRNIGPIWFCSQWNLCRNEGHSGVYVFFIGSESFVRKCDAKSTFKVLKFVVQSLQFLRISTKTWLYLGIKRQKRSEACWPRNEVYFFHADKKNYAKKVKYFFVNYFFYFFLKKV